MGKNRTRTILVSMPTINRPERLKLDGILAYAHEKTGERWHIALDFGALNGRPEPINAQCADGVIAYIDSDRRRGDVVAAGVPAVLIEDMLTPDSGPRAKHVVTILCDHREEGRAAAEYFIDRHFANFAWLGPETETEWSLARRRGFEERLAESGLRSTDIGGNQGLLAERLAGLEKPCALFASHDFKAREAIDAAAAAGIAVPRDLAVLGVDDDTAICTTVAPAISSLPTNDERLGYAAGRLLNELLRSGGGGRTIRFASRRVITRMSTDADALSDRFVADAIRYARTHLSARLDAATLARRIGYSKRMLQLRAERALGHTLGEEIRQIRLAAAKELIAETDMAVADIAEECGFTSTSHLALRFRESTGMTPLAWRGKTRGI